MCVMRFSRHRKNISVSSEWWFLTGTAGRLSRRLVLTSSASSDSGNSGRNVSWLFLTESTSSDVGNSGSMVSWLLSALIYSSNAGNSGSMVSWLLSTSRCFRDAGNSGSVDRRLSQASRYSSDAGNSGNDIRAFWVISRTVIWGGKLSGSEDRFKRFSWSSLNWLMRHSLSRETASFRFSPGSACFSHLSHAEK